MSWLSFHFHHGLSPSMIIIIINDICIAIYEFKKYPPISRNSNRKLIFKISRQFMQIRTWIVHIHNVIRGI